MEIDDEALRSAIDQIIKDWARDDELVIASEFIEAEAHLLAQVAVAGYLSALEAKGLVIVPVEPTEEMLYAGRDTATPLLVAGPLLPQLKNRLRLQYRAMLASARKGGG